MTSNGPATADRWAVSTRTSGTVLTAGVALPTIQLGILGIPQGFTPVEIESWLRDLAGVALETSRSDQRPRPIPALLHHALTGLLFSQSELWSHTGQALPCSAVFVDGPLGTAFGWVGSARVMLLVNGEPFEPQWVIVRDEAGREAMSAMLPRDVHVMLTLEYRPNGEDGSASPASMDAESGNMPESQPQTAPIAAREPAPAASTPAPAPINELAPLPTPTPAPPLSPLPIAAALPVDQPGLAPDPAALPLDRPDVAQSLPSTHHPSSSTFAMPKLPGTSSTPAADATVSDPAESTTGSALTLTPATPPPGEPTPDQLPAATLATEPTAPPAVWTPQQPPVAPEPMTPASAAAIEMPATTPAVTPAPQAETPVVTAPTLTPFDARDRASRSEDPRHDDARHDEPGHPVGRWLSKMLGFGKRTPAPAPEPEPVSSTPLSSYDALLGDKASATPEPTPAPVSEPVVAQESLALPATNVDITEPRPLAPAAEQAPISVPTPTALKRGGLAPAGLADILGTQPIKPVVKPLEGLTGSFSPSAAAELVAVPTTTPEALGTPLYPILDVDVPKEVVEQPVVIDHEPVGAAENFDIPPVPEREVAPPVEPAAVVPSAPEPSPAPEPVAPAPVATTPVVPSEPVVAASEPPTADPELPEPPADFLAEFAASMETVEPAAAPPAPTPVAGPPVLRVTPPAKPPAVPVITQPRPESTPVAVPEPVASAPTAPVAPAAPSAPTFVPVGPPAGVAPTPGGPPARPTMAFLRIPTAADPVPVVPAEQAGMMREIPLPSRSAEMRNPLREAAASAATPAAAASATPDAPATPAAPEAAAPDTIVRAPQASNASDMPDGMLVATAATPMPAGTRPKLSSSWPAPEELEPSETPIWRKPWAIGLFIAVFVGVGWFVGHSQAPDNDVHGTPMSRALRSVGLGGARFSVTIDSDPPGAWIAVDGKDVSRRTPSTVELPPGEHQVTLSMPDLGSVQVAVRGQNGQKLKISEPLHGSLDVTALDPSLPVKVSLDGQPQGWLPAHIAKLPPGLHELQFNGPNMQPWAQQVSVPIRKTATLVARPMMSPATGVVQVQASMNDDNGTAPLNGAAVFIDGEMRGSTPLKLELPRGPHSLRVMYQGESAPVQVIDLPGGNQRFASFQFGLDSDLPPLKLQGSYAVLPAKRVNTISATLDGLSVRDIRESFLHIKAGDGLWRRVEMTVANGPRGAVVSGVFPNNLFDASGRVQWYLSAATTQGDEFYTEMQRSSR